MNNLIGFTLGLGNELSPVLNTASKDYDKFVKAITAYNRTAVTKSGQMMQTLAGMVDAFDQLPKKASLAYAKARTAIKQRMKPIVQQIEFTVGSKGRKQLEAGVKSALIKALSKSTIRLSAAKPISKSGAFAGGKSLASSYHKIVQPPDFVGRFRNLPRFAKGGPVPGPMGGPSDTVHALLTPGEYVLTKEQRSGLAGVLKDMRSLNKMQGAAQTLKSAAAVGATGAGAALSQLLGTINARMGVLDKKVQGLDAFTLRNVLPHLGEMKGQVEGLNEGTGKTVGLFERLFTQLLGPTRFLAINKALGVVGEGVHNLVQASQETFAGGGVQDFITNFNQINQKLGLSRAQLSQLKKEAGGVISSYGGAFNFAEYSEGFESLANAGMRDTAVMKELAATTVLVSKATGAGRDSIGKLLYELMNVGKLSKTQTEDVAAAIAQTSQSTSTDAQGLIDSMQTNIREMNNFFMKQNADVQTAILKNMTALQGALVNDFGDTGNLISDTLSKALGGDTGAQSQIMQLTGLGTDQIGQMLQSGKGLDQIIGGIESRAKALAASGANFSDAAHVLGDVLDPSSLSAFVSKGGSMVNTLTDLQKQFMSTGNAQEYLKKRTLDNQTTWQTWTSEIYNAISSLNVFGLSGAEVIDFMKEFGVQNAFALTYLGKTAIAAGAAALEFLGLKKAKEAAGLASAVSSASSAATSAESVVASGSSVATGATGLGAVGGFIKNVGVGTGAAIQGFFTGFAEGLYIFTPALITFGAAMIGPGGLGLLAIIGTILSFAVAARIATPPLKLLADVAIAGIGSIVDIFKVMSTMKPSQLLAIGPALIATGAGFTALGAGVLAGSTMLLLAIPALAAFNAVSGVIGNGAPGAGRMAMTINAIASAFVVDPKQVKVALDGVTDSAKFLTALGALAVGMSIAGTISGGGVVGWFVSGIRDFFMGDPMQNLADDSSRIAKVINTVAQNIGSVKVDGMPEAAKKVAIIASFMEDYAKIEKATSAAAPTGGLVGMIVDFFTGDSLVNLQKQSGMITRSINVLVDTWAGFQPSDKLPAVAKKLKPVGEFLESYGKIVDGIKKGASGLTTGGLLDSLGGGGLWKAVKLLFTGDDITDFIKNASGIKTAITSLITNFSDPTYLANQANVDATTAGLKMAGDLMTAAIPVFDAAEKGREISSKLDHGWFQRWFGGQGTLTEMANTSKDISGVVTSLVGNFASLSYLSGTGFDKGIDASVLALDGGAKVLNSAFALIQARQNLNATSIDQVKEAAGYVSSLTQQMNVPALNPDDVARVVAVRVEGSVDANDTRTHELLEALIARIDAGAGGAQPGGGPAVARPMSSEASSFANGNVM